MEANGLRSSPRLTPATLLLLLVFCVTFLWWCWSSSFFYSSYFGPGLKAACDSGGRLASWNRSDPSPCVSWHGVVTCAGGRITRLVLEGLSTSPALTRLDQLRVLRLKSNRLSGPIPDFSSLSVLKDRNL
ncbi:hypothetical protein OPV22_000848 [Ensete ventricosum]|uniref:Leucine-rich repeat-containing N-terminal plant-type domain-containing protein n=1 Tax=Ensete ventricosum TaxID=4639 RepID=A0AAV8RVW5_ENSVE|nr:hypothetical protein OPV22_000848 [Ensete ventricosum]RWW31207.1 hypothetical protein GW17_00004170 [Ensete ventricosum]RZR93312.1 hypothetical protein BHM03_00021774 [Ensete ventricosum]